MPLFTERLWSICNIPEIFGISIFTGGSFTGLTVIVKDFSLLLHPLFSIPPSSLNVIFTTDIPFSLSFI
jgi:hypothetical protein